MRFLLLPLLLVLQACPNRQVIDEADPPPDHHTSQLSVDWAGTYSGVRADGEIMVVTLASDSPCRWRIGSEISSKAIREGALIWDAAGRSIQLVAEGEEPTFWQVGERVLFQLNASGQRLTIANGQPYTLRMAPYPERLSDVTWVLTELSGTAIGEDQEATLRFHPVDGQVNGSASCNRYFGPYRQEGSRLTIGPRLGATRMACPEMSLEATFLTLLPQTVGYHRDPDGLTLLGEKEERLAHFREKP